jgi:23S rRNA pseudouridine2604 synthase
MKEERNAKKRTAPLRPLRRSLPRARKDAAHENPSSPEAIFPMRLNKYLAWKKYATRRGADVLIDAGNVTVNGKVGVLGDKVMANDVVEVRQTGKQKEWAYYAYHKPRGIITHSPSHFEKDILSTIDLKDVFPIGRLDKDSDGLIILTNDGRITERLLHPRFDHEKEYLVTTKEPLRSSFKSKMEAGVKIEREMTKPCKVRVLDSHTFRVTLTEGKKHQIRRMCVALFQEVKDLTRIRVMTVELGSLKPGQYRKLAGSEKARFLKALDLA